MERNMNSFQRFELGDEAEIFEADRKAFRGEETD
jgi:hypothetical protein